MAPEDQKGSSSIDHSRQRWEPENFNDDLEREQSGSVESERRQSQGRQGDLTELAAPRPVADSRRRADSLEQEEERASLRRKSHASSATERDGELTEVAAPAPVERDAQSDEERTPQSSEEKQEAEEAEPSYSQKATEVYTVSWLIFFSFLGTLARLGVEAITTYPNAPWSSPVLWANLGGSFALGFLSEDRNLFRHEWAGQHSTKNSFHHSRISKDTDSTRANAAAAHGKVKKTIPLYIGLATGFCGSFTSFSSFMRDVFLALTNDLPLVSSSPYRKSPIHFQTSHTDDLPDESTTISSRNGGYSCLALLAILIVQIAVSLSALNVGAHFALLTSRLMPALPFTLTRKVLDPLAVVLAFGCWLGAILLSIFPPTTNWRSRATFSLVFAPLGCLLRFYASKYLNARIPSFPLGTFFVNILGTCVLGMCYDLQHTRSIGAFSGGSYTACAVLEGVMEGFCGCVTTVSTWVAEMNSLRRRHAYIYGGASVGIALACLVVIMGSVGWTSGFRRPICT